MMFGNVCCTVELLASPLVSTCLAELPHIIGLAGVWFRHGLIRRCLQILGFDRSSARVQLPLKLSLRVDLYLNPRGKNAECTWEGMDAGSCVPPTGGSSSGSGFLFPWGSFGLSGLQFWKIRSSFGMVPLVGSLHLDTRIGSSGPGKGEVVAPFASR
jgi:hypothetical protein